MQMVFIRLLLLMMLLFVMAPAPAHAQEASPLLNDGLINDGLAVVELFSSQACVFCPQADQLFSDLGAQERVIGLACHVDYFDVKKGTLSQPFCTQRQTAYMARLNAGPNYTPQMVIDGRYETLGYKQDKVMTALAYALDKAPVRRLGIVAGDGADHFTLFPLKEEMARAPSNGDQPLTLWLAAYDKPHDLTIAEGGNKGKAVTYRRIVSGQKDLGLWQGTAPHDFSFALKEGQAGFVVLASRGPQGPIIAAGEYKKPAAMPSAQAPEAVIQPEVVFEGPSAN